MRFGLKEEVIDSIAKVFSSFPEVEQVILYGSRAKGNFKPYSDIDLTLKGEKLNATIVNKINSDLDDLLLPYTIDLSYINYIKNQDPLDHIARVGIVIYENKFAGIQE